LGILKSKNIMLRVWGQSCRGCLNHTNTN